MLIEVSGHRSSKFKNMVTIAIQDYCDRIMSRKLQESIYLKVFIKKKLEEKGIEAYCHYVSFEDGIREFEIVIKKGSSLRNFLLYLAHECVHMKQLASGELKDGVRTCRWQGQIVEDSIDYWDQPWEIEAYGREKGLYHRFITNYKKENKVYLDRAVK
jgi:hypothetical protein